MNKTKQSPSLVIVFVCNKLNIIGYKRSRTKKIGGGAFRGKLFNFLKNMLRPNIEETLFVAQNDFICVLLFRTDVNILHYIFVFSSKNTL